MNEKILVINIHSSKNVGDAALLQVTLKQLRENFPASKILLCMDDPDSHTGPEEMINSISSWVYAYNNDKSAGWNYFRLAMLLPVTLFPLLCYKLFKRKIHIFTPASIRKIVDAYLDSDLVISKPGGFLYSSGRGITLLIAIYSIIFADWAGKPIYIFPQSIGPLNRKWEAFLIRKLFERCTNCYGSRASFVAVIKEYWLKKSICLFITRSGFLLCLLKNLMLVTTGCWK